MAVVKQISIPQTGVTIEKFDEAASLVAQTIQSDPEFYINRMAAVAMGLVNPTKQQFEALKLLFGKKVPDAPREFNISSKESVEVVFKRFLEDNPVSFAETLSRAKDITPQELAITEAITGD
jgi:hypothetical protein